MLFDVAGWKPLRCEMQHKIRPSCRPPSDCSWIFSWGPLIPLGTSVTAPDQAKTKNAIEIGHRPGNILLQPVAPSSSSGGGGGEGSRTAMPVLLDWGLAKTLPENLRIAFSRYVIVMLSLFSLSFEVDFRFSRSQCFPASGASADTQGDKGEKDESKMRPSFFNRCWIGLWYSRCGWDRGM